jgi:hypothetical protein
MHGEDGEGCNVTITIVWTDSMAGADNTVAYILLLKPRLRKKCVWLKWTEYMAGEDNMAEHSLMMELKIKNEICVGKIVRVKTSQQSGQTTWQVRTIWRNTDSF